MFTTDKIAKLSFRLNLVLLTAQGLVLLSSWRFLPPKLPLFYSRPWGEEQLTNALGLWLVPAFSLTVLLANLAGSLLVREESLAKQMLAVAGVVFSFLGLVALVQIIRLII